ncbi:MAG: 50S ribosomal protein L3 [Oscillospiraceae bacterium]|jgi:large subunit ribosomal protein L3|nr:50S ribosomal protein L3 [Oscillospiraceae bacterium]
MQKAIIGKKVGMTQIFDEAGRVIPVTIIQAGPCTVTQIRTPERDGYTAVQLGFEDVAERKLTKSERGHFEKAGVPLKKYLKEFDLEGEYKTGDVIEAAAFEAGDRVDVTGVSKGKGYAGVIKRHGYGRKAMSHGGGPVHRHLGSTGSGSDPSRVFPGKKMAGHMGSEQVTVLNLDVVKTDAELGIIAVRGAVPGPRGGLVYIRNSVKNA